MGETSDGGAESDGSLNGSADCFTFIPYTFERFVLIVGIGCPMAFIGMINNSILLRFFSDKKRRNSPFLYLCVIAFLDILFCLNYILIMGGDAFSIYTQQDIFWFIWTHYSIFLYGFTRIVEVACPYIIIGASIERYILSSDSSKRSLQLFTSNKSRKIIISGIIIMTFVVRGIMLGAMKQLTNFHENCSSSYFESYSVDAADFVMTAEFQYYDMYFMPVIQTFIPIPVLLILNILIIRNLRRRYSAFKEQRRESWVPSRKESCIRKNGNLHASAYTSPALSLNHHLPYNGDSGHHSPDVGNANSADIYSTKLEAALEMAEHCELLQDGNDVSKNVLIEADPDSTINHELTHMATSTLDIFHQRQEQQKELKAEKMRIRGATITLIAIVTSYLIITSFSLFIRILEQLPDKPLLMDGHYPTNFYTIASDVCSILVVLNAFIRIFIYLVTIRELRKEVPKYCCCTC